MRCAVVATGDAIDAGLIGRVLGEYREMPGLALTIEQARRLWGCDAVTWQRIAEVLVERQKLRWSRRASHSSGVGLRDRDEHLA
jgi:hypothetical protein